MQDELEIAAETIPIEETTEIVADQQSPQVESLEEGHILKPCYIVDKTMTDLVLSIWKQKKTTAYHKRQREKYAAFEAAVFAITNASPIMNVEFELTPEEIARQQEAVANLTDEHKANLISKL